MNMLAKIVISLLLTTVLCVVVVIARGWKIFAIKRALRGKKCQLPSVN
jgi:hypothetical protein